MRDNGGGVTIKKGSIDPQNVRQELAVTQSAQVQDTTGSQNGWTSAPAITGYSVVGVALITSIIGPFIRSKLKSKK